jgi:hypothetical protein
MQRAILSMVLKTGKSLMLMMVELNRLMNSFFGIKCISPVPSNASCQKTSRCIYGNRAESVRSRSSSLTFSIFPLRSPIISTWGLQISSSTTSLVMVLQLAVALGMSVSVVIFRTKVLFAFLAMVFNWFSRLSSKITMLIFRNNTFSAEF